MCSSTRTRERGRGLALTMVLGLLLTMLGGVLEAPRPAVAAAAIPIVGSSASPRSNSPQLAHDNNAKTVWRTTGRRTPKRAWIAFDLGDVQTIGAIEWSFAKSGYADHVTIQSSVDGGEWKGVTRIGNARAGTTQSWDGELTARYVRFWFSNPRKDRVLGALAEVRFRAPRERLAGATLPYKTDDGLCQRIGIAAYFDPATYWNDAIAGAPETGLMILNVNSGVDEKGKFQREFRDVTDKARAQGIVVLGYIFTNLGKRPSSEVNRETDLYFEWYGVDGIFLDNTPHDGNHLDYYRGLADHARNVQAEAIVAMNPGYSPDRRYMSFVDVMVTYEYDYASYRKQTFPSWTLDYPPDRFMHMVHSVPSAEAASNALRLAKERNAGYVFVTDVSDENVIYRSLGGLWQQQLAEACP